MYVKAIYDFTAPEGGEIPLAIGDIILVLQQINGDWSKGTNLSRKSETGNFPTNHVVPVDVPVVGKDQKVFVGARTFDSGVDGDLLFEKGDIICGIMAVDSNWWHGELNHNFGIFPLTHVFELIPAASSLSATVAEDSAKYSNQSLYNQPNLIELSDASKASKTTTEHFNESDKTVLALGNHIETSMLDSQQQTTSQQPSDSKEEVVARVRAALSLSAQLEDELGFSEGDIIEVLKVVDEDFVIGRLQGASGQVPVAFVEVIEGSIKFEAAAEQKRNSKFDWWKDASAADAISKKGNRSSLEFCPSFEEQTASIADDFSFDPLGSCDAGNVVQNDVIETNGSDFHHCDDSLSLASDASMQHDKSFLPAYMRTLFPFAAENSNELSFKADVVVTVISQVDDQWTEGELEGVRGIFPTSYVEVICDYVPPCISPRRSAVSIVLNDVSEAKTVKVNTGLPTVRSRPSSVESTKCSSTSEAIDDGIFNEGLDANELIADETENCAENFPQLTLIEAPETPGTKPQVVQPEFVEPGILVSPESSVEFSNFENVKFSSVKSKDTQPDIAQNNASRDESMVLCCNVQNGTVDSLLINELTADNTASSSSNLEKDDQNQKNFCDDLHSSASNVLTLSTQAVAGKNKDLPHSVVPDKVSASPSTEVKSLIPVSKKPLITRPKPAVKPKPNFPVLANTENNNTSNKNSFSDSSGISSNHIPSDGNPTGLHENIIDAQVKKAHERLRNPAMNSVISELERKDSKPMTLPERPNKLVLRKQTNAIELDEPLTMEPLMDTTNENCTEVLLENLLNVTPVAVQIRDRSSKANRSVTFNLPDEDSFPERAGSGTPSTKPRIPDRSSSCDSCRSGSTTNSSESSGVQIGQSLFYASTRSDLELMSSRATIQKEPVSMSMFYVGLTDPVSSSVGDANKSKAVPPRPSRPRVGSSPVSPGVVTGSGGAKGHEGKLVPCRPAPPRPAPGRRLQSSDSGSVELDSLTEENEEIIADLQRRIAELEQDLKNCHQSKVSQRLKLVTASEEEKADIVESLEFYKANIVGLSEELKQLKESVRHRLRWQSPARASVQAQELARLEAERRDEEERCQRAACESEELRARRRDTRARGVEELVQTESDFQHSLCLCLEMVFRPEAEKCPASVDLDTLLGNIYDVVELSQKFLNMLETNTAGKPHEEQMIGSIFEALKEEFKQVYKIYCRNHNDVISLLEKYAGVQEAQDYFDALLGSMRQHATVFTVGSILIKPVQRIMRYPLLLEQILKSTEEAHSDHGHLVTAVRTMTDVLVIINEFKRRKDLVLKYKKVAQTSFTDMISRVNVHSFEKKWSRISMKLAGIQTSDENFAREENKFKSLIIWVRCLIKDISRYIEVTQESLGMMEAVANDVSDWYGDQSRDADQFCRSSSRISSALFSKFRMQVDAEVVPPLSSLLTMCDGPIKVIKKRRDKLLDYDSALIRLKSNRDAEQIKPMQDDVQLCRQTYEALNAQLLEDLPRLNALAGAVVCDCLRQFLRVHACFCAETCAEACTLKQLANIANADPALGIVEAFNFSHSEVVDRLSSDLAFVPKSFNPLADEWRSMKVTRRSSEYGSLPMTPDEEVRSVVDAREALRLRYPASKLHVVAQDFEGSQLLDLRLTRGTVVGVVKEGDPMGNKNRFFVDNGSHKGFILKNYLSPLADEEVVQPAESPAVLREMDEVCSVIDSLATNPFLSMDSSTCSPCSRLSISSKTSSDSADEGCINAPVMETKMAENAASIETKAADDTASIESDSHGMEADNTYEATFSFAAGGEVEVNLEEGQRVHVLQKHDLTGNTDWWLVVAGGRQGYVPSSYLHKTQPDCDP